MSSSTGCSRSSCPAKASSCSTANSAYPEMMPSRLLKSCATPPTSWPRLSSRSDCCSRRCSRSRSAAIRSRSRSASIAIRSVTSRTATMISIPASVGMLLSRTSVGNWVPSLRSPHTVDACQCALDRSSTKYRSAPARMSARWSSGTRIVRSRPTSSWPAYPYIRAAAAFTITIEPSRVTPSMASGAISNRLRRLSSARSRSAVAATSLARISSTSRLRPAISGGPTIGMACWDVPSETSRTDCASCCNGRNIPRQTPMITSAVLAAATTIIAMSAPSSTSCARSSESMTDCCSAVICDSRPYPVFKTAVTYGKTWAVSACSACAAAASPRRSAASCGSATWTTQACWAAVRAPSRAVSAGSPLAYAATWAAKPRAAAPAASTAVRPPACPSVTAVRNRARWSASLVVRSSAAAATGTSRRPSSLT